MRYLPARAYRNYIFLIPLSAIALLYTITYTTSLIRLEARGSQIAQSPFYLDAGIIGDLTPEGKKAGLREDDQVLSVDGQLLEGDRDFYRAIQNHRPGDHLLVTVTSKDRPQPATVRVPLAQRRPAKVPIEDWALAIFNCALKLFCIVLGIYVAAVLPNDPRALIFFGLMIGTSLVWMNAAWYDFPNWLWPLADLFGFAGMYSWGLWLVCFGLYFPDRFKWDLHRPWLKWLFLGPLALYTILVVTETTSAFYNERALSVLESLSDDARLVLSVCVGFFFASLGTRIGTARTPDARRRLRILYFGSLIGLTPIGCVVLYDFLAPRFGLPAVSDEVLLPVVLVFCVFPGSLAYVIVVERAMNVRMVIRQGVRYALARGGLRFLVSLVATLVLFWVNPLIFGSNMDPGVQIAFLLAAIVVVSFLIRSTRNRLGDWLDRHFFREAYDAQLILENLSESVRSIVDERKLLDTVAHQISASLHVPHFAVLLSGNGEFRPIYNLGLDLRKDVALPENSKTVEVINGSAEPPQIYFDNQDNWVYSTSDSELVTLKALRTQLLLPVGPKGKLVGILSLGTKLSEEPYSRSDVQLLRSVAVQTGLALENSRLTKAIAEEAAQRERLNREIEIAREVQQQLFPQPLPPMAGIDLSGACRPALGVGGDYYDFLPLPNGDLGIAIGDVSGKGIAAALLMASLHASLRGQILMGRGNLAQLMSNINHLIFQATPANRYATFFYGQYQRGTNTLTYVNAGHNAPFVLRRTADGTVHVIRLETGGPVVGLFADAPYQEGCVNLVPGDIFVGFTDGVSEAMNSADEEWGEERLIPAVEKIASRPAAEIIPDIMTEADRFAAGAPQHDDMTLLVLKVFQAAA